MIIGITGISGSGKSTLSSLIETFGKDFYHIDIDKIGHQVLNDPDVQEEIRKQFNIKVSSTNRAALGDKIFQDRNEMKKLSNIMWGKMGVLIDQRIATHKNCILDWILLPHTDYFKKCNIRILVKPSNLEIRDKKVKERDNITLESLKLRDNASISYNEADFNYIIINNYNSN